MTRLAWLTDQLFRTVGGCARAAGEQLLWESESLLRRAVASRHRVRLRVPVNEGEKMLHVLRKALMLSLAAAIGVGVVAAVAAAGPGNSPAITFVSPSPSEGATLTSRSATFAFSYNRTTKQTRSVVCSLSGPSTSLSGPCDDLVNITGGARADKSYSNL